jgi:LacI family transcriptional regulator
LVSIGDSIPGAQTAAEIVFDNASGVATALELLAAAGHRRIVVLTPSAPSTPDRPAEAAVTRVADQLGLDATLRTSPHDLDGAAAVARAALTATPPPTAFFCLADSMAYGVYAAAAELGLAIPADVSVLGFDDNQVSRLLTPPMSTFRWPVEELVTYAVERTVRAIEENKRSRRKVCTPQAMPRGSVGPPRAPR